MASDSDRVAALFDGDLPVVSPPSGRHVIPFAPPMPTAFWGSVTYSYQNGKLVSAEIKETVKP